MGTSVTGCCPEAGDLLLRRVDSLLHVNAHHVFVVSPLETTHTLYWCPSPSSLLASLPLTQPTQVGWTAVVSASVWQRMLKILGNINEIQRPSIHAEAMAYLQTIWKALADVSWLSDLCF